MNEYQANPRPPGQLTAPRRNRYFHGKLLTAAHLEMEQDYFNQKRWMLNRLGHGMGVLCGLRVTARDGQVCISAGVAIDGLGREIIVPGGVCLDPWRPTDDCGVPGEPLSNEENHKVYICLAYRECPADYGPALVTDCNTDDACEAGTVVEGYWLLVRQGQPAQPPRAIGDELCMDLFKPGEQDRTVVERLHRLCRQLSVGCPSPQDPCVVLASVQLNAGGGVGEIDACTARPIVLSNAVLLDLILCLAEQVEECCAPPSTPPQDQPVKVSGIDFLNTNNRRILRLDDPKQVAEIKASQNLAAIRIAFTADVDHDSIRAGGANQDPQTFSLLVQGSWSDQPDRYIPGLVTPQSSTVTRFSIDPEFKTFRPGEYSLVLFGQEDPAGKRPAVAGLNGVRLDGEPTAFPTGDDEEGGDFVIRFKVS